MESNLSPYLKIDRIEFMVTYQCSGKCKHCSVAPCLNNIAGGRHVKADKAVEAIEALSKLYHISSVMTFGGEPLLYPEVVCAIHEKAAECGIAVRQVITNGYFTRDAAKRRAVAYALAQAGVNDLLLSVDAFHQENIPVDAVHDFAESATHAGFPKMRLQPAWVVDALHDNPYNIKTREVLDGFSDLAIPVSDGNNIFLAGNARTYLSQYYEKHELNFSDKCGTMPYTDPLTEISSLSIVPNGDVTACGFVIGNIYSEDMRDIVARYDPYANDVMRAILEGGVPALLAYAQAAGITIDLSQCCSICDICGLVRDRLAVK